MVKFKKINFYGNYFNSLIKICNPLSNLNKLIFILLILIL